MTHETRTVRNIGESHGFTLIELTVVLALMAMLVVAATFCLSGPYREAKLTAAGEQIGLFDQHIRGHARRFGQPAELRLHLGSNTLQATTVGQSTLPVRRLQLPGGTRIDRVLVTDRLLTSGRVTIQFTGQGRSPGYAFRLYTSAKEKRWVVVAGLTGQTILLNDEQAVQDLLASEVPRS